MSILLLILKNVKYCVGLALNYWTRSCALLYVGPHDQILRLHRHMVISTNLVAWTTQVYDGKVACSFRSTDGDRLDDDAISRTSTLGKTKSEANH